MPGPPPKRSEDRRRDNKPVIPIAKAPGAPVVRVPPADPSWDPIAKRWYKSLKESGQSRWYEPSDWSTAYLLAESLSRDLAPQFVGFRQIDVRETEAVYARIPLKGGSLSAYITAMNNLLTTEGARRKALIELNRNPQKDNDEEASVTAISVYRAALEA